ncbi:MAG: sigma-70 family RNA polymerase sigma factor [Planctomycetes bacterium]|nr:sigma-70 family RNA polymerase sigma factor [Planctomycetota bacterium]
MSAPPTTPNSWGTDHSLLRNVRSGDQDAAAELYVRYARRLRALVRARSTPELARQLEPDDIVQSVFRKFFHRLREGHYDVPPGEELWGLFLVIALNKIRAAESYHRAGKRNCHRARRLPEDTPARSTDADDLSCALLQMTLEEALNELPPVRRAIVRLRIEGYEIDEIALRANRSKRTVERTLHDVRRRLREVLQLEDR